MEHVSATSILTRTRRPTFSSCGPPAAFVCPAVNSVRCDHRPCDDDEDAPEDDYRTLHSLLPHPCNGHSPARSSDGAKSLGQVIRRSAGGCCIVNKWAFRPCPPSGSLHLRSVSRYARPARDASYSPSQRQRAARDCPKRSPQCSALAHGRARRCCRARPGRVE